VKLGLRGKILLIATGVVLAGLTAGLISSVYFFNNLYVASLQSRSIAIAQSLRLQMDRILQLGIQMDNLVGFDKQCVAVVESYEGIAFAMVVNREGHILFHSDVAQQGHSLASPELLAAARSKVDLTTAYTLEHLSGYSASVPIFATDGEHLGSVLVGVSAKVIDNKLMPMYQNLLLVGLLALVCGAGVILMALSHFITQPIQVFVQSLRHLQNHTTDLSQRVIWESADELGDLAQAFNGLMSTLQEATVSKSSLTEAYIALQASEETNRKQKLLLDTVLNNIDAMVYMKDLEGRYVYANACAAAILGQSQEGIQGKRDADIMSRTEAERLGRMEHRVLELGQRISGEEVLVDASGVTRHFWLMKIPIMENGKVTASVGISTDISETVRLKQQFELLANTDPMTAISNRRHFISEAARELKRMYRAGENLAVIMFDIDKFKAINDLYGHAAGDRAILALVDVCRRMRRETDLLGRLGGDEFVIVLPRTDPMEALAAAERLREAIAKTSVIGNEHEIILITVSLGVALSDGVCSLDDVINRADVALYHAKQHGRNRTSLYGHAKEAPQDSADSRLALFDAKI
jgi:diguanylate cyclase (GGDEF)-like protein/PAS domain S-box-containing protein